MIAEPRFRACRAALLPLLCFGALAVALGPAAATPDPLALDADTFSRELARRFQYPPPPQPESVDDPAAGRALDAGYFAAFVDYDRSYSDAARRAAIRKLQALRAGAARMTHEQFVLGVAEIAALADNAHTSIGSNAFMKDTPRLPIRTYLFEDGLHVLRASPQLRDLLGARIDRIAGLPVDEIYSRIRRYVGGTEIRRRLSLIPMLESPALLRAAGIGDADDTLLVEGRLADGTLFTRRIAAEIRGRAAPVSGTARLLFPLPDRPDAPLASFLTEQGDLPFYLRDRTRLFSTHSMDSGALYIGLTFNADGDEEPIGEFLSSAIEQVRSGDPPFVVLDMRMNGGGDYTTTYRFASDLVAALPAPRRIYVLTSGWTFSAAITTVAALEQAGRDRVVLVGEPVGDRLSFWAEGDAFVLPNSALTVFYSTGRHEYRRPCTDLEECFWLNYRYPVRVSSLAPDLSAPLTFAAYRERRDPAIEAVLRAEAE